MQRMNKEGIRHGNFAPLPNREAYAYEFDGYTIDVQNRSLWHDNQPVSLTAKAFDILLVLVQNNGRVIEKTELLSKVWPETFVEEINLNVHISYLRKALGESAANQQYIETIPKRGYRFHAQIHAIGAEPDEAAGETRDRPEALVPLSPGRTFEDILQERKSTAQAAQEIVAAPSSAPVDTSLLSQTPVIPARQPHGKEWLVIWAIAIAALVVITIVIYVTRSPLPTAKPFPDLTKTKLTSSGKNLLPTLSPDGDYVAYVQDEAGKQSLWVMQTTTRSAVQIIAPATVVYEDVTFAPDGKLIYYDTSDTETQEGTLYQIPLLGGSARKVMPQVASHITFSPDGRQFAFVRGNFFHEQTALVVASADGHQQQVLLTRTKPEMVANWSGLSWSPDGRLIGCAVRRFDGAELVLQLTTINVETREETSIGQSNWENIGQLAWLHDQSGLVVNAIQPAASVFGYQLWHISYPGGEPTRLTDDLISYEGVSLTRNSRAFVSATSEQVSRIWIAPGSKLDDARPTSSALSDNYSQLFGMDWTGKNQIVYGSYKSGNADIWVMEADGTRQQQLTLMPTRETSPVVSADGRYVVFVSRGAGPGHLWRIDSNGENLKQLTSGQGEYNPTLTPDGKWVVYSGFHSGLQSIYKVSIDGGEAMPITREWSIRPQVSPDGKQIAYLKKLGHGEGIVVALMPLAGGDPSAFFPQMPVPDHLLLRWSPDGRALHFINTVDGVSNIWSQPVAGGRPQPLTHFQTDRIFRFAWSRNGKVLAFDRGMTLSDVVLFTTMK